jgi:hypothetical protein
MMANRFSDSAANVLRIIGVVFSLTSPVLHAAPGDLEKGWENPPQEARLRAYWWWLNGNVTAASITRDLAEMKAKGFGGALICDAGGATQDGNAPVPAGPVFMSAEWRALYRHALREAARLGLEMSLNIQSGWNLGGPGVTADDAAKKLVWTETALTPASPAETRLPMPKIRENHYKDLFVIAYPEKSPDSKTAENKDPVPSGSTGRPLRNFQEKAMHRTLHFSAPDTTPLLTDIPATPGEEDCAPDEIVNLADKVGKDGVLRWKPPSGTWRVLRFGYTIGDHAFVSTCSKGWEGYAIDVLDDGAFNRYWDAVVAPLIADAGPLAGKTLAYLHTDSWEVEAVNWTPSLREEFRSRRGYDFLPWLPVMAGKIVGDRDRSNRFLHDFRKTLGDLAIDHHYKPFIARAEKHGLRIHPESGGPHASPIDAQRCLGMNHTPMSEFWAWSWKHRVGDENRFFVKQPASAAHVNGRKLVAAEGFTTIGPHWQETLWDNLKPSFDHACTEGLNLLFWHAFVCSPEEMGIPGQQYFAGTHLNPNVTWWSKSEPFFSYINRCQWMLQQGAFVADACYYYGDHVPNFAKHRSSDPAGMSAARDYDVITEDAILHRLDCKDGHLVLPDGMSYRVMILRDHEAISLPVLRKLDELTAKGAKIIGRRPVKATGLTGHPASDDELRTIADRLWGTGKITEGTSGDAFLTNIDVSPDFTWSGDAKPQSIGYIHRRTADADIYFVNNREPVAVRLDATFRIGRTGVELWDAVSGARRLVAAETDGASTRLPLALPPCGSVFVVFRGEPSRTAAPAAPPEPVGMLDLSNDWHARFDPRWGGPAGEVAFSTLTDWTQNKEPGIRHYSGTAIYQKSFIWKGTPPADGLLIDLGEVKELADVKLNGRPLGVLWAKPFRIAIPAGSLREGDNRLVVEIVNFWPNRIIGDANLPPEKRLTKTNVRKLTACTPLMPSGLLGPVRIVRTPE